MKINQRKAERVVKYSRIVVVVVFLDVVGLFASKLNVNGVHILADGAHV